MAEALRRRVIILGSTGSIGTQALEVIHRNPERFEVVGIAAGQNRDLARSQADALGLSHHRVVFGAADATALVGDVSCDVVLNGITGSVGLLPTLAALESGATLALANKESLIAAGPVVQPLLSIPGAEIVPIDSEHCALHQCLRSSFEPEREVRRLLLTASGGPFRGKVADELAGVTVESALAHPTWAMGPKITVDSSTLMNKGLEVIEAHELYGTPYDQIEVVVHPQSVVHSMVEFSDGSTIAQLSMPTMHLPIGYALGYPDRTRVPFGAIDWTTLSRLDFEPPDRETFRCLDLAYQAGRAGGTAPAWLSAANEVAVAAFLSGKVRWNAIADVCVDVLERHDGATPVCVADVIEADQVARRIAEEIVEQQ